jgi:adenylylsulfate kinase
MKEKSHIFPQNYTITRSDINNINGHKSIVIWFSGLSGSGKSTLANEIQLELHKKLISAYILDGDNLRNGLNKDLGFTAEDREENIRRVAEVSKILLDAGFNEIES